MNRCRHRLQREKEHCVSVHFPKRDQAAAADDAAVDVADAAA